MIYTYVCTYNRKKISEYCLKTIWENKKDSLVTIDDDKSDRDIVEVILKYSDKAIFNFNHLGINELRRLQLEYFNITANDNDLFYLTDSDCLHDENYVAKLEYFYDKYRDCAISLYNATNLFYCHTIEQSEVYYANRISGCSMLLNKNMVAMILKNFSTLELDWDKKVCSILFENKTNMIVSKISYVEHLGMGGIHNADFESDSAMSPTQYLINKRKEFMK